jgi:outer membrane protein
MTQPKIFYPGTFVRSLKHRMNRNLFFATVMATGLAALSVSSTATAQATAPAPAPAAAPAAPPVPVAPQALPAKVAIIAFEQAVVATNEGQKAVADIQKKYEPKKNQIDAEAKEVDSLKAQNQALPATATDEARAKLLRDIDKKEKDLQHDAEAAQNDYQADLQEAFGKIQQKVGNLAVKYAEDNGFTLLLNYPDPRQQTPNQILWFAQPMDITEAVVNQYNKVSGVAAPPPAAPTPHKTTAPAAPKPAAPKQ